MYIYNSCYTISSLLNGLRQLTKSNKEKNTEHGPIKKVFSFLKNVGFCIMCFSILVQVYILYIPVYVVITSVGIWSKLF